MGEEKKNIDLLFKARLGSQAIMPPEEIWDGIEDAMPKKLFFKFRYEHMNIYYCSLIVLCFLFSAGTFAYVLTHGDKAAFTPNSMPAEGLNYNRSDKNGTEVLPENNKVYNSRNKSSDTRKQNNADHNNGERTVSKKDTMQRSIQAVKDTIKPVTEHQVAKPVPQKTDLPLKKTKKVVYVTDYDTIVKYDTLRTKRKK